MAEGILKKAGQLYRSAYAKALPVVMEKGGQYLQNAEVLPMGTPNPVNIAKKGMDFYSGLFSAQAAEPTTEIITPAPAVVSQQPQQGDWLGGLMGGIGGILGGVGSFAQKNPELFTGLTTMAIGAGSGFTGLESAGLGGQAYGREKAESQRQYEENLKLLAAMGKSADSAQKDITETIKNELDLYGAKLSPEQRQEYINLRLQGKRPVYQGGLFGAGFR